MFKTKISSQGTISLPASLRKKYGFVPGEIVTIEDNGRITIVKNTNFATLRAENAKYLPDTPIAYKSGDGLATHIKEKYAK